MQISKIERSLPIPIGGLLVLVVIVCLPTPIIAQSVNRPSELRQKPQQISVAVESPSQREAHESAPAPDLSTCAACVSINFPVTPGLKLLISEKD